MHTRNYLNLATIILIVIYINLLLSVPDYPDKPDKALQRAKTAQKNSSPWLQCSFAGAENASESEKAASEHRRILRDITKYGQSFVRQGHTISCQ